MSRSYKKHPVGGICSSGGQKAYRSQENRAKRTKVRQKLKKGRYDELPHEKEYGDEWLSPRDGKMYWKPTKHELNQYNAHNWMSLLYIKTLRK
jgi:hypothetical protein